MARVQNASANFAQRKYANKADVLTLNWLPIRECIEFSILKLAFKALYFDD